MNDHLTETASFLAKHIPDLKNKIVHEADLALEGMLILPGSGGEPIFVGNPPKWKENPTPRKDIEAVYVLNRMEHWKTLLEAFLLTGEGKYARKVTSELMDWIRTVKRPDLPSFGDPVAGAAELRYRFDAGDERFAPWRSLEAGFRMFQSWYLIPACLEGTPYMTDKIRTELEESVREHLEVLAAVSPLLYPEADHNHYLMEMFGLFFASCRWCSLPLSGEQKKLAMRELKRCVLRQYGKEGGQLEGCPHYHNECLVLLMRSLLEAGKNGISFDRDYEERIAGALVYSLHTCRPTGVNVPWGDSDASTAPVKSALYGWYAFGDAAPVEAVKRLAGPKILNEVFEATIWDCPHPERFQEILGGEGKTFTLPETAWFRTLSQACVRSSWDREALSVFFACRLPVQNEHAHMDPGGFDFTAYGRNMIADPGRYTYNEIPERRLFKSAFSHSTLTVNGCEPFEYRSSWAYGMQGQGSVTHAAWDSENCGLFRMEAVHRFDGFVHRRTVAAGFWEPRPFLAVLDRVEGLKKEDSITLHFHVNSTRAGEQAGGLVFGNEGGGPSLLIGWAGEGKAILRAGFISEEMDRRRPSLILDYLEPEGERKKIRYFATVLVPLRPGESAGLRGIRVGEEGAHLVLEGRAYHISWKS